MRGTVEKFNHWTKLFVGVGEGAVGCMCWWSWYHRLEPNRYSEGKIKAGYMCIKDPHVLLVKLIAPWQSQATIFVATFRMGDRTD